MYIVISNNKSEQQFDFISNIHSKLVEHFKNEVNTSQPLHLKTINGFLGRIYHYTRNDCKQVVNELAKRELVEIKKGSGIANYFIVIKRCC